jgi:hypothetical protein
VSAPPPSRVPQPPRLRGRLRTAAAGGLACGAALLAILFPTGCGGGVLSGDLFEVKRSGSVPGAALTLVVNEGGTVRCNGGKPLPISDPQLVLARGIQEELKEAVASHQDLAPRAGSVFSYYLRDEEGYVRFSDNSTGQSKIMRELQGFVLDVGRGVCHNAG